jgi:hypothetical protein
VNIIRQSGSIRCKPGLYYYPFRIFANWEENNFGEISMANLPRNVFTTCPKEEARREPVVTNVEYKIFGQFNGTTNMSSPLMIVKGEITLDHVRKAAKCAKLTSFVVRKLASDTLIESFPIKCNVVIEIPKQKPKEIVVAPVANEYKIYRSTDKKLLGVCKGVVTFTAIEHAAKCAGFKKFTVYRQATGTPIECTTSSLFKHDIYLREKRKPYVYNVCESTSVAPVRKPKPAPKKSVVKENTIFGVKGNVLMIVKGPITIDDALKSGRCAKLGGIRAFSNGVELFRYNFPFKGSIVVTDINGIPKTVSPNQQLIKEAIKGLSQAMDSLTKLKKSL